MTDEMIRRDDEYWDEVARAVGTGTPSILLGTSTRSLRKNLERLRESAERNQRECPSCGGPCPPRLLACSVSCMRIERYRSIAAGQGDPFGGERVR